MLLILNSERYSAELFLINLQNRFLCGREGGTKFICYRFHYWV